MEDNTLTLIESSNALEVINRSEVDMQIATAKKYPRKLSNVIEEITELATHDPETAAACYYNLEVSKGQVVNGLSVRFAEILAYSWGNLRVATRIVGQDAKTITAQAICFDLEKNLAISTEVQASILDKQGNRFHDRLIVTTGKAAASKAFRDAIYKVVPRASLKAVLDQVKLVAAKQVVDLTTMRNSLIEWYGKRGIKEKDLLEYMGVDVKEEMTADMCLQLKGLSVAINEGEVTAEAAITDELKARRKAAKAEAEATTKKEKVAQAMAQA